MISESVFLPPDVFVLIYAHIAKLAYPKVNSFYIYQSYKTKQKTFHGLSVSECFSISQARNLFFLTSFLLLLLVKQIFIQI